MLNIAICDDSREDRKRLRKFLEETGFLVSIQEFESGEALLRLEEPFPVIFLDIDMKGISGIETARLLRKKDKKAKIIYVTAYDDFREYAFSVHAFAYLVKPLDGEKIRQILKEAMEYTESTRRKRWTFFWALRRRLAFAKSEAGIFSTWNTGTGKFVL